MEANVSEGILGMVSFSFWKLGREPVLDWIFSHYIFMAVREHVTLRGARRLLDSYPPGALGHPAPGSLLWAYSRCVITTMFADFTFSVVNIVEDLVRSQLKPGLSFVQCVTRIMVHLDFQMKNLETISGLTDFRDVCFHLFISPYTQKIVEAITNMYESVVVDSLFSTKDFRDGVRIQEFSETRYQGLKKHLKDWQNNADNNQPDPRIHIKALVRNRGNIAHGNKLRHKGQVQLTTMVRDLEVILDNLRYHLASALPRVMGVTANNVVFTKVDAFPYLESRPYCYP